jgi:hypothetical protein
MMAISPKPSDANRSYQVYRLGRGHLAARAMS